MNEVTGFSILFASVGLLFVSLSIPLIFKKVPPNSFYGCRTTRTLSDVNIWYESNQRFGRKFFVSGLLIFIASLVVLSFRHLLSSDHAAIILLGVLILSLAGTVRKSVKP